MELIGLHILLTYSCNFECDHCFVWGSPWQTGTFTLGKLSAVLRQAREVKTIREIYFEGGEPFLFYPILVDAVGRAKQMGFRTGIVTNGYWATGVEDAWVWLQSLSAAGLDSLDISCDDYHGEIEPGNDDNGRPKMQPALVAAKDLFLQTGTIALDPPDRMRDPAEAKPGEPLAGGGVMYRGRAAENLTADLPGQPWQHFTSCPYEDLANPGRVHLDPFGNLHLCQGVVMGNLFERPLKEILKDFDPENHPIAGPLIKGGPARLVEEYGLDHEEGYVDACHICYEARKKLRSRFPAELGPDQMYGVLGEA